MVENKKIKNGVLGIDENNDNNSQTQKRQFKKIEGRNPEKPDRRKDC